MQSSTQQAIHRKSSELRYTQESNLMSRTIHSRLYESVQLQGGSLIQGKSYDSTYKQGFPKIYSFENVNAFHGKSGVSLDAKSKYSFRNDYSKIVEDNSVLLRQNAFLREEVNRLNLLLETQKRSATGRFEAERLSVLLAQKDNEIRILNQKIFSLQSRASQASLSNEWQIKYNQSQTTVNQLNIRISQLTQQLLNYESQITQLRQQLQSGSSSVQYESQISQLNLTINQYKQQISQLTIQINEYQSRIQVLEQKSSREGSSSRKDGEINELRNQLTSLSYKLQQYEEHISQYEQTFTQYESQISSLQQTNWKLEERISKQTNEMGSMPSQVDEEIRIFEEGKLGLKVIILLEQINRLKQKEQELTIKSQQLHAYLLKAENYIQQIQLQLQRNNLKQNIPAHIVQKVTHLQQQNIKYSRLIEELQSRLAVGQVSAVSEDEYYGRIGERDLRIIILLEEVNRLNHKNLEIRQNLAQAEDFIEQLQTAIIPPQIQNQINYLSEENHRLNLLIENYISQIKHLKLNLQAPSIPKIQYQVPSEVQNRLAFLAAQNQRLNRQLIELQNRPANLEIPEHFENELAKMTLQKIILLEQINRLNAVVKEIHEHLIHAENYIEQCEIRISQIEQSITETTVNHTVEFKIPPEVDSRIFELTQQNERLNRIIYEIQNQPTRVETRVEQKVEFRIPPEIEKRINMLAAENQRIERELSLQRSQEPEQDDSLTLEYGKLYFKSIVLLEEINRLNFLINDLKGFLMNAENYIYEIEKRQVSVPAEFEQEMMNLRQENQKLHAEINRISLSFEQKIIEYKSEISTINSQLASFRSQTSTYKSRVAQLERLSSSSTSVSSSSQNQLQLRWAAEHFRVIVLLEEINRLNKKCEDIDAQRFEVIRHLERAEIYIQDLEARYARLEATGTKQSTITTQSSSGLEVQSLRLELVDLENLKRVEVAEKDLRIIFLLQEINRLNQKVAGMSTSENSGTTGQIWALRRENQRCQGELHQVLGHLRNAEDYITKLLRQSEEFAAQRERLINQLNRFRR